MLKFGLLGEKLSHSKSPNIHMEIMRQRGIQGSYELIEIPGATFTEDFQELKALGYTGVNVTIPYKEAVLPLMDEVSAHAKYIGAVNTVLFENGKAIGFNTDYDGFLALLTKNNIEVKGKEAVILGSGGAAKTVAKVLLDNGIYDITVVSRTKQNFHGTYAVSYDYFKEIKSKNDILINCTPVGMYPSVDASPLDKEYINTNVIVDLIYNPEETLLIKYGRELGINGINGSTMLYEQAVKAQDIWAGE